MGEQLDRMGQAVSMNFQDPMLDEMLKHRDELIEKFEIHQKERETIIESGSAGVKQEKVFEGKKAMKKLEKLKSLE